MTLLEFEGAGPDGLSGLLLALWWDGKGDWEKAHGIAQDVDGRDGAWVHAYLHRREGDIGNAGYWYRQAGRPVATGGLREEWEGIVGELLGRQRGVGLMLTRKASPSGLIGSNWLRTGQRPNASTRCRARTSCP